jgi:hypothetical protein
MNIKVKQTKVARVLCLLAHYALVGCGEDNFPKFEMLGGLRVLALRADQGSQFSGTAEFSPGDTVVVTPYVSFYNVTGTPTFEVKACPDPGVNVGATPSCEGVAGVVSVGSGTVALSGGVSSTGQAAPFTVTVPMDVLNARSLVAQYNGVSYIVIYRMTSADGIIVVSSFKRLPVSLASKTKNQNPAVSGLLGNGVTLSTVPTAEAAVGISYMASAREAYSVMAIDGLLQSASEDLLATYFITDGKLKYIRTVNEQTTQYTPSATISTDHTPLIVAVIRDSRGGIAFKTAQ